MNFKRSTHSAIRRTLVLWLACHLLATWSASLMAQDIRPNMTRDVALMVYCPQVFDDENKKLPWPKIVTADRQEFACGTGGFLTTGGVRKTENGFWLVGLRSGRGIVELRASFLGPPSREDPTLKGQIFSVTNVEYGDWLHIRAAPAPFSEHVGGIPRLQDNLRATGRTAQWKSSTWIEVEFIANMGWVLTGELDRIDQDEIIFSNTNTIVGWVNGRYLKTTITETPPAVELNSYFGDDRLEVSANVEGSKKLRSVFGYRDSAGRYWRVPANYVTDGASIPWLLWGIVGRPFDDDHIRAAIIHDYFCDVRRRTWRETHLVFYEALRASGVSDTKANAMYFAVQRFGPRWSEQRVQCFYVCAEQGEVANYLEPKFDESDWQEGLRKAQDANTTIEELERLADQQLRDPDTVVRYEQATLSATGEIQQKTEAHISIRDLTQAGMDPGDPDYGSKYLAVYQLLDRKQFDKVHKNYEKRGVTGPIR